LCSKCAESSSRSHCAVVSTIYNAAPNKTIVLRESFAPGLKKITQ